MCGRYALALRPSQIRRMLEDEDMAVWDAPDDEADDAPRQSYNFAPGYNGVVYRADTPDWGAGPSRERRATEHTRPEDPTPEEDEEEAAVHKGAETYSGAAGGEVRYKLQTMKWGLIPFWTKRNPDYASMLKTINCRDDSLSTSGGLWTTMKARKRCIVIAQGFYEWLKVGPKEKVPHYIKRKDGQLMCMAGLWDCVQYEDAEKKLFTYTIITTDSNKQLKFLHDRMPVILNMGSKDLKTWLDPNRYEWSKDLQALLRPFGGELEIYAVSKDVGKVGNNSPSFIIPIASKENKSNIANFFANAAAKNDKQLKVSAFSVKTGEDAKKEPEPISSKETEVDKPSPVKGIKRELPESPTGRVAKKVATKASPRKISATSNGTKSPVKAKQGGSQKITTFFASNA